MSGLRVEIDLDKIGDNARHLVGLAAARDISITAVTKAVLGNPDVARVLTDAGVVALADSRVENVERLRRAGVVDPIWLIRSPMPSQIDRIVAGGAVSVNSETAVLTALASAAHRSGRVHEVIVMVELGDLRDGVMPAMLSETVEHVLRLPGLGLQGIGTNLACRSGIAPSVANMGELSDLAEMVEAAFGIELPIVSGGNSANLEWMSQARDVGRINNLRLGEAILLGRDPLTRQPLAHAHTDAFELVAEVIESKRKPTKARGRHGQNAFGEVSATLDRGEIWQTIVAVGQQDVAPFGLRGSTDVTILSASSDHLVTETSHQMAPGDELRFVPDYSALLRAMTSPFVEQRTHAGGQVRPPGPPGVLAGVR